MLIRDFKPRLYQETILAKVVESNTLVVLPTGMGKTAIAMMLGAQRLMQYPKSKVLVLAPTRPLCDQHMKTFRRFLRVGEEEVVLFTGHVKPEKRAELWKKARVIVSTPQGLENDLIGGKINVSDVSLLVFDEAHRAVKNYSYVWVAKQYARQAMHSRILALTASPGSDVESIKEVCRNLKIEEIEIRTEQDPDVKPYIQNVELKWVKVKLPLIFKDIQKYLSDCFKSKVKEIKNLGFISSIRVVSKRELLGVSAHLHKEISSGNRSMGILRAVSLAAEAMKVQHALELLESQGIVALLEYFDKLMKESRVRKVKAVKNLVNDINFRSAYVKTKSLGDKGVEHPKLSKLREMVRENVDKKIIVFNQYRDSANDVVNELNLLPGVEARLFVGQQKKKGTGLTQKEQIKMLKEFSDGKFNVLVSSSVGEEGLDIPQVDLVVFFEPVPSAIRTIQRRGRTGRLASGNVIVLMTEGTRDEAYRWSAHHKEKRMFRTLNDLRGKLKLDVVKHKTLNDYNKTNVKVFADYREKGSGVIKELIDLGAEIKLGSLKVGDYVLSSRVGVEFKTVEDFVNSILDGRLLLQLKELKRNYERAVVIVEGVDDIYSVRGVHPNSIRGMLATIAVSYGIPVLFTRHFRDTANILHIIAKREQGESGSGFTLHAEKKPLSLKELQEYIVSSLPGVGGTLNKPLLQRFGSVKGVVIASESELKEVDKIGELKAKKIREVLDGEYSHRS